MIHDLYLMSSTSWVEAASRRNFEHRTLSFTEMAASCKCRAAAPRNAKRTPDAKNLFALVLQGVMRG